MLDLTALREEYTRAELSEQDALMNPLDVFTRWFEQAQNAQVPEPNAMVLSTVSQQGRPRSRVLLLKEVRAEGFVWFTNYESDKGHELQGNPKAAMLFFWQGLQRQVRIEGVVKKVTAKESDAYFHSRPLASQLGAWSSPQSQKIANRDVLEQNLNTFTKQFGTQPPRPEHWGGYILEPDYLEFWQGRASRLHDRLAYERCDGVWAISRLAP